MRRCSTITNAWLFLLCFHFLKAAKKFCCLELDSSKIQRSRPLKSSTAMEGWLINSKLSTDTFQLCVSWMLCFSSFSCDQFFQDDAKARFYTLFHSAAFRFHFSVPKYSSKHHRLHQNRCFLHFQGQIIVCWSCKDSFTSCRAPIRCFLAFSSLHLVVNPWKVQK